jgi:hypothetical protein
MASLFGAMKDRCAQSRQAQQNGCDGLSLPNEQSRVSYRAVMPTAARFAEQRIRAPRSNV